MNEFNDESEQIHTVHTGSGAHQTPVYWVPTGRSFPGCKAYVKQTTQPQLVPRARKSGFMQPLPQYVFMASCLVKHYNNLAFLTFSYLFNDHHKKPQQAYNLLRSYGEALLSTLLHTNVQVFIEFVEYTSAVKRERRKISL
jgi:hypothetical protein